MRKYWWVLKVLTMLFVAMMVFGFLVLALWNWLLPSLFGLPSITFVQAVGLLVLSRIFFGGFRHRGGGPPWRWRIEAKLAGMSPEQRAKFRAGLQGGRGFGRGEFHSRSAGESTGE